MHQGSPLSPFLFNIYMEYVTKKIKKQIALKIGRINYQYWFYADDLIFYCSIFQLKDIIEIIRNISNKYSLYLNEKKSGIFAISNKSLIN